MLCIGAEDDDGESAIGRGKPSYTPKSVVVPVNNDEKPKQVATPNKTDAAVAKVEEKKAGGFGVKKTEVKKDENGWD